VGQIMAELPFEIRYSLSRRQRLVPHLRVWGVGYSLFAVALFLFFCVEAAVSVCTLTWPSAAVSGALAFGAFLLRRGLFVGSTSSWSPCRTWTFAWRKTAWECLRAASGGGSSWTG
jgi:hypothetical protein